MEKIIKILGWVILGITVVFSLIFLFSDAPKLEAELAVIQDFSQEEKIAETHNIATNWTGVVLTYTYIILALCTIGVVGFALLKFILNTKDEPKSAIKPLITFGSLILILLISYFLGSDSITGLEHIKSENVTPAMAKWVDSSIYAMYVFLGITVISLIYGEVSKAWK